MDEPVTPARSLLSQPKEVVKKARNLGKPDWKSWPVYDEAANGLLNYWYPVIWANQLMDVAQDIVRPLSPQQASSTVTASSSDSLVSTEASSSMPRRRRNDSGSTPRRSSWTLGKGGSWGARKT